MLVKAAYWAWRGENHFGGLLMLTEAACQVYLGGSCCGGLSAGAASWAGWVLKGIVGQGSGVSKVNEERQK